MPLHLNSITNNSRKTDALAWMLQNGMNKSESLFITEDKKYLHIRCNIPDRLSGKTVGKLVYTIVNCENALQILDLDIVWENSVPTLLRFNALREGSSDANEYYDAEVKDGGQHLEIETVNRHVIPEDIIDTEREVYISAFPFELNVYDDIAAFNAWAGFGNGVQVGDTDLTVQGLSERFMMPGGILNDKKQKDESYSFVLGKVVSYREVEIEFGETVYQFVLAMMDTALGIIPVSMGRDVFDLRNLRAGCMVAMNADIKADLAKDDYFKYING